MKKQDLFADTSDFIAVIGSNMVGELNCSIARLVGESNSRTIPLWLIRHNLSYVYLLLRLLRSVTENVLEQPCEKKCRNEDARMKQANMI